MNDVKSNRARSFPAISMMVVTVIEARMGRGPRPAFRFLGVTTTEPRLAIEKVSQRLGVPFKEIRTLGEDGYLYAIAQEDGLATQVRAKRCPVARDIPFRPRPERPATRASKCR